MTTNTLKTHKQQIPNHVIYAVEGYIRTYIILFIPPPLKDLIILYSAEILNSPTFDYLRDFDCNGLIYWLGTNCYTQQWQNPAEMSLITVTTSGLMVDSKPASCIVGRQCVRCITKPLKHAWIIIDFNDFAIKPTKYTLRHYSSCDGEALRNWVLEGSLDGESWTIIRKHYNDESLKCKGQSYTWSLDGTESYFSMFRIYQFETNSSDHYALICSGFEIYGDVYCQHKTMEFDVWPTNKSEHLKTSKEGKAVINTGSGDSWQTVKSQQPLIYDTKTQTNEFSILVENCKTTTNSWKCMVGIAPDTFICKASRQWLGSQKSWAYIGGTGGKCYDNPKSIPYGDKWGHNIGHIVTVKSNIKTKCIEFILNGVSQGIAFDNYNLNGRNMFAAVSMTATWSELRLMEKVSPRNKLYSKKSKQAQKTNVIVAPPPILNPHINYGWDQNRKSSQLSIYPDGVTVENKGSNDMWQGVVSQIAFSSGKNSFEIHIMNDVKTSNQWKYIIGVVPISFHPNRTAWIGSQQSWGYIGGTGSKCHDSNKAIPYGKRYSDQGRIKCICDFDQGTIEWFRNDESQGVAFDNLNGVVHPAVSLTGKGAIVKICNVQYSH